MTFGADHYVPVLKIKRGEKRALQGIQPSLMKSITPLLEIVERKKDKKPTVEAHLKTAFADLAKSTRMYSRCFLDAREIEPDGPSAAAEVFRRASVAGIVFTPVTGLSRSVDVAAALSHRTYGIALRLTRGELDDGGLAGKLREFMGRHALAAEETDLIVDLGPVDDMVAPGVAALTEAFLDEVPDHGKWRTLTVSACAFPPSMGGVTRNSYLSVDRTEWIAWRDELHAHRRELIRLPTFSDCGIQYPSGVEGFDPRIMQVSATIRYTLDEAWLLIKGESTRVKPPSRQFPALATQLVYGFHGRHFADVGHCSGCRSIKAAADGTPGLGSAEAWRRLGSVHHITTVVRSLASLP